MNKTETRTATIFLDENDIMHIVMRDDVTLDYEDAIDNSLVIRDLSKGKKVLKLVDSRADWSIEKKARDFVNSKEIKENTIARAVVKSSFLSTKLVNFFTILNKPRVPAKIFTDYDEAYQWLLEIKKAEEK